MHTKLLLSFAISALLMTGCGSSKQPPIEKLSSAEAQIKIAQDSEARGTRDLLEAQEILQQAKEASAKEDYEKAARLADQALDRARLAQERARSASERQATEDLRESVDTLRKEVNRKTP